ncbi:MAG: nucleoside deaminase [Bacteroidota bacterium]
MKRKGFSKMLIAISLTIFLFGCENSNQPKTLELPFQKYSMEDNEVQKEIDEIYSLLAYSIVFKDWQPDSIPRNKRRGYNIGTILIDKNNELANWGLNCINSTDNATQHGEVRAITSYLDSLKSFNLEGFTLYTTLEPCAMCSGMATMTNVERVVYGQRDVDFSGALDRLALNSEEFGGFKPYPRTVTLDPAPSSFREQLDEKFRKFLETDDEKFLAKFLTSKEAYEIYQNAYQVFQNYKVINNGNIKHYNNAKLFLMNLKI